MGGLGGCRGVLQGGGGSRLCVCVCFGVWGVGCGLGGSWVVLLIGHLVSLLVAGCLFVDWFVCLSAHGCLLVG